MLAPSTPQLDARALEEALLCYTPRLKAFTLSFIDDDTSFELPAHLWSSSKELHTLTLDHKSPFDIVLALLSAPLVRLRLHPHSSANSTLSLVNLRGCSKISSLYFDPQAHRHSHPRIGREGGRTREGCSKLARRGLSPSRGGGGRKVSCVTKGQYADSGKRSGGLVSSLHCRAPPLVADPPSRFAGEGAVAV